MLPALCYTTRMDEIISPPMEPLAIIVGIEEYQFSGGRQGIPLVDYARKDAEAFRTLLIDHFGLAPDQIIMWLDHEATRAALENELQYHLRNLKKNSQLFFYYAGHGYRVGDENLLTTWDSHPANIEGTSVSLRKILLDPLSASACEQSLIFVDACAKNLPSLGRDLISSFDPEEFRKFINSTGYHAQFMACSMGERSYSSPVLKHGIWTWHLIQALQGADPKAIARDRTITDVSLRDYLKHTIPEFITKKTEIKGKQTPWANICAGNTFEIRTLPAPETESGQTIASIEINYEDAFFRRIETLPIRSLGGFMKRHTVPDRINSATESFVARVAESDSSLEVNKIYENLKNNLRLKRKAIEKGVGNGGGNVDTPLFRFILDVKQDPQDPSDAIITRTLTLRCDPKDLPENFDSVFPERMTEMVVPFSGKADFDSLVDAFEDLEEVHGGSLREDDDAGTITYRMPEGSTLIIHCEDSEIVVRPTNTATILGLIEGTKSALKELEAEERKLLN